MSRIGPPPAPGDRPLWECPHCGAKLVRRNLSHSCGKFSVAAFLAGKTARARALFARFARSIAACGPHLVAPAQTRVAFMVRVRFASVNRVADAAIDVHFVLPRALHSARFRRVERLGNCYVHHLRLTRPRDFDGELRRWLRQSYTEYGEQGWLARSRPTPPPPAARERPRASAPRSAAPTGPDSGRCSPRSKRSVRRTATSGSASSGISRTLRTTSRPPRSRSRASATDVRALRPR